MSIEKRKEFNQIKRKESHKSTNACKQFTKRGVFMMPNSLDFFFPLLYNNEEDTLFCINQEFMWFF